MKLQNADECICVHCDGEGMVTGRICKQCNGHGVVLVKEWSCYQGIKAYSPTPKMQEAIDRLGTA